MKIAIPTAEGNLCMHFGHCEQFAIIEVDDANKTITKTTMETPPPHEPGLLPRWLAEKKVVLVIAGGMGMRAQQLFQEQNITTIVGAPVDSPENLVKTYLEGKLVSGENACDH